MEPVNVYKIQPKEVVGGGSNKYKNKYIKYKQKYLNLRKNME